MSLDPRITPARPDLAAKHLEGKVNAARFVAGETREVIDAQTPVRERPAPDAPLMTEALMGERVTIYEFDDEGWAWGQLAADGYVGWLAASALLAPRDPPDAQGERAANAGLSRTVDQAAAGRDAAARRNDRGRARAGPLRGFSAGIFAGRASGADSKRKRPISSPSPSASSARRICGAAKPITDLTAPGWCRSR